MLTVLGNISPTGLQGWRGVVRFCQVIDRVWVVWYNYSMSIVPSKSYPTVKFRSTLDIRHRLRDIHFFYRF